MSLLIASALSSPLGDSLPTEIVYIPEGEHRIHPTVNGKPKAVTVKVPVERGSEIAAALQSALEKRKGSNVRPWFDFEHKAGKASALPQSFRYEPGKGIVAAVEWTNAGRAAVEGKDFSYFSPVFLLGENGLPAGIPERGPLGALVNEPAFREIPRIAAKDAETDSTTHRTMPSLILAALGIDEAHHDAEKSAVAKIEAMKADAAKASALEKERDDARAEADQLKTEAADARKSRAKALVEAAQRDGRIAPKDEATAKKYLDRLEAGDTFAEEVLAGLPKRNEGLDRSVIAANAATPPAAGSIEARAAQLVAAGQAKTIDEGIEVIAASDPKAYGDYLASLRG